ncbi:MAG: ABC transporter substrate-binding protein [Defluviitaleaceae bacterium]|nr:ABC transporter substrate-binding protein [Defluviitaleaceae bacterium]
MRLFLKHLKNLFFIIFLVACGTENIENEIINITRTNISVGIEDEISPTTGGTLNISMNNPTTLNPIINTDISVSNVLNLIYEPLFEIENFIANPVLAERLTVLQDNTSVIVSLANRNWSDGVRVTTNDILFTINTIRNNPSSPYFELVRYINNIEIIDSTNISFGFSRAIGGRFENYLTFPIIPEHFFSGMLNQRNLQALGTGPFMIHSRSFPREMVLIQNPNVVDRAYISAIRVIIISDTETNLNALSQNIINSFVSNISDLTRYSFSFVNFNINPLVTNNLDFLAFNFDNIILHNLSLRAAIAHSLLDRDFIDISYFGLANRTSSIVNSQNSFYKQGLNYYDFDIEKITELLHTAGFIEIEENVLGSIVSNVSIPLSLRILVNEENASRVAISERLKQNLENLGINVILMNLSFEDYKVQIQNRNFDLLFAGTSIGNNFSDLFSSSGVNNFMNYSSARLDEYLQEINNAFTIEEYSYLLKNIQTYINEQLPIVGITFISNVLLTNQSIVIEGKPSIRNPYNNIREWFIMH